MGGQPLDIVNVDSTQTPPDVDFVRPGAIPPPVELQRPTTTHPHERPAALSRQEATR